MQRLSTDPIHLHHVRIYAHDETVVFGFSEGIQEAPDDAAFAAFVTKHALQVRDIDTPPEGSISTRHIEVRPPPDDETLQEFGRLCVGSAAEQGIADYWPGILVIDNQDELPDPSRKEARGEIIASWS